MCKSSAFSVYQFIKFLRGCSILNKIQFLIKNKSFRVENLSPFVQNHHLCLCDLPLSIPPLLPVQHISGCLFDTVQDLKTSFLQFPILNFDSYAKSLSIYQYINFKLSHHFLFCHLIFQFPCVYYFAYGLCLCPLLSTQLAAVLCLVWFTMHNIAILFFIGNQSVLFCPHLNLTIPLLGLVRTVFLFLLVFFFLCRVSQNQMHYLSQDN